MKTVTKEDFEAFLADFSDDGFHEINSRRVDAIYGGSMTEFSNPDVGLIAINHENSHRPDSFQICE